MSDGGALEQVAAEFGFTFDMEELARGSRGVDAMIGRVGALGTALAAGSGIAAVMGFADSFAHQANEVRNASTELGINTDQLQAMRLGFADAGVSGDELTGALRRLNRTIGAAAHGGQQQSQALHALGVSARGAHGEIGTLADMLPEIMDGFQRITNPTEASARAQQLFGRAGARLVPILQRGRAGLADMNTELARFGGGISQHAIESAHRYEEAQHRLDVVTVGFRASVAEGLLPVLGQLMTKGGELVTAFHHVADNSQIVQHTLQALGVVGAVVGAELLLPWVPLIVAVGGAVFVWDELKTTMEGGDSILRRFIESHYGVERGAEIVASLNETWTAFKGALVEIPADLRVLKDSAVEALSTIWTWAQRILPPLGLLVDSVRFLASHWDQITHASEFINRINPGAALGRGIANWATGPSTSTSHPTESRGELVTHLGDLQQLGGVQDPAQRRAEAERLGLAHATGGVQGAPQTAQAPLVAALGHLANVTRPNVITHGPTSIVVHGATDPQATAAEIRRQLDERDRQRANDADGDHLVPAQGES